MTRILMVCTGNICRSPTAEGVLRDKLRAAGLADRIAVDSAGTHSYHEGSPPSSPAVKAARKRGYDLTPLRARRVRPEDYIDFDLLLAMDRGHQALLEYDRPPDGKARVRLFMDFAPEGPDEVPDPYYGGNRDYERALDLIESAMPGLIDALQREAS